MHSSLQMFVTFLTPVQFGQPTFLTSIVSANCCYEMCRSLAMKGATIFLFTSIKLVHSCPICGSDVADVQSSRNSSSHRCIVLLDIRSVLYKPSISSHTGLVVRPQLTQSRITPCCTVLKSALSELNFNKNFNTHDYLVGSKGASIRTKI